MARGRPNPRCANWNARQRVVARLKASPDGWTCALCGREIKRNPQYPSTHPLSWSCDEIIPVSKGGSPYDINNCQPAHRICNMRRQNKPMTNKKSFNNLPQSRNWKEKK